MLHSYQQYLPITIAGNEKTVNRVLQETLIQTQPDNKGNIEYIPLRELVKVTPAEDLKSITAGRNGEFVPFDFYGVRDADRLVKDVKQVAGNTGEWDAGFSGSFFSNREMLDELVVILLISLLLMYFILSAQFESFLQPFACPGGNSDRRGIRASAALDLRAYAEPDVSHRAYRHLRYRNQ